MICLDDAVAALRDVKHENKTKFDSTNDRKRQYDGTRGNVFDRLGLRKEAQHSGTLMTNGFHKPQEGFNMNQTPNGSRHSYPGFQPMQFDPNTRVSQDLYPNQRPRIPANTGLKENTACHDCGEKEHWKGDIECKDRKKVKFDLSNIGTNGTKPSNHFQ